MAYLANDYVPGATATAGVLDGHPDWLVGFVAAGITYTFSRYMKLSTKNSGLWAGLAFVLELL